MDVFFLTAVILSKAKDPCKCVLACSRPGLSPEKFADTVVDRSSLGSFDPLRMTAFESAQRVEAAWAF